MKAQKQQRSIKRLVSVGASTILLSVHCRARMSSNRSGARIVGFDTGTYFIRVDLVILGIEPSEFPTLMVAREDQDIVNTCAPVIRALGGNPDLARSVADYIARMVEDVQANPEGDDSWHGDRRLTISDNQCATGWRPR